MDNDRKSDDRPLAATGGDRRSQAAEKGASLSAQGYH